MNNEPTETKTNEQINVTEIQSDSTPNIQNNQSDIAEINPKINPSNKTNFTPTYRSPNGQGTNITSKHTIRRKLSWVGIFIGVGLIIYSIYLLNQARTCDGSFCGLGYGILSLISFGVSFIILLLAFAGIATTSKSYLDSNSKKYSKIGIISGSLILLVLILALIGITNICSSELAGSLSVSSASIKILTPIIIIILLGLSLGLNIMFKSLRVKRRRLFIPITLVCIIISIIIFGIFDYNYIKNKDAERFLPSNSAEITGNYKWYTTTSKDNAINEIVVKFDVKAKKDIKLDASISINDYSFAYKDDISLKKNETTNLSINIPIENIISGENDELLKSGKFDVTNIKLVDREGDHKTSDEKSNVISGQIDPNKIDFNTLSLDYSPTMISGTAYSQLHKIKLVQLTFNEGKTYYDAMPKAGDLFLTNKLDWYAEFNMKGSYWVKARMIDENDQVIELNSRNSDNIYFTI